MTKKLALALAAASLATASYVETNPAEGSCAFEGTTITVACGDNMHGDPDPIHCGTQTYDDLTSCENSDAGCTDFTALRDIDACTGCANWGTIDVDWCDGAGCCCGSNGTCGTG